MSTYTSGDAARGAGRAEIGGLRCEGLRVRFGALRALHDVTLSFQPGQLHSIIGPNGAGKTTLINVLSGRQKPHAGRVLMGDSDITSTGANQRARAGIGRSFQITKIFPGISVLENLRLAAQAHVFTVQPFWRSETSYANLQERALSVLDEIGIHHLRDRPAELLSHGDQRALELGITLMTEPQILLLDEPLAGVGEHEIEGMMSVIKRASLGRTVVLIEHNIDVVMRVSHRVVVMNQGEVLCIGTPEDVRKDAAVREAYLGDEHAAA